MFLLGLAEIRVKYQFAEYAACKLELSFIYCTLNKNNGVTFLAAGDSVIHTQAATIVRFSVTQRADLNGLIVPR